MSTLHNISLLVGFAAVVLDLQKQFIRVLHMQNPVLQHHSTPLTSIVSYLHRATCSTRISVLRLASSTADILLSALSLHRFHRTFPYCRCTDFSFAASPYDLVPANLPQVSEGVAIATFRLRLRPVDNSVNTSLPCYGILLNEGIEKLTIDTSKCRALICMHTFHSTCMCAGTNEIYGSWSIVNLCAATMLLYCMQPINARAT